MNEKENLLNEYKGNLFEFLIGNLTAHQFNIASDYLQKIPANYLARLQNYEKQVRFLEPSLLKKLGYLAGQSADLLFHYFQEKEIFLKSVELVGKIKGHNHRGEKSQKEFDYAEGDILLLTKEDKTIPLGLKLFRSGAFVNTKNAGLRSFLTQYFPYDYLQKEQDKLNKIIDTEFFSLGHKLYADEGLEFFGSFGSEWGESGQGYLPGELRPQQREYLQIYYDATISQVYKFFKMMKEKEGESFFKYLMPFCGLTHPDLIQLACYHQDHQFVKAHIITYQEVLSSVETFKLEALVKGKTSFKFSSEALDLQIRVKPMNKFTQPSLKINCSVRFKLLK